MQTIRVLHCNSHSDGWTADSPDLAGWSISADSFGESKTLAEEAVRAKLDGDADEAQITHHIACSRGERRPVGRAARDRVDLDEHVVVVLLEVEPGRISACPPPGP